MDNEFKKRLIDYFDPGELVEMLGITTEYIVELFEEEVQEAAEDLEEYMDYGTRG